MTVESKNLSNDSLKHWVFLNKDTHSFHGVYNSYREAAEAAKGLEEAEERVSHLMLNPDTQHLYDGEEYEDY